MRIQNNVNFNKILRLLYFSNVYIWNIKGYD